MNKSDGKARLVGINHVALEVGDLEEALAFYGELFDFTLRGRSSGMAFIDMGDQFIALAEGRSQGPDAHRHFGLVVDDRASLHSRLEKLGAKILPGSGLDFLDPWGNHIQVVEYQNIQFSKVPAVLAGMDMAHLGKNAQALKELQDKGMAPASARDQG
jgi:catechol 2,3-dioxygenase-like lactoylglutathione lyase family enzyme